MNNYTFNDLTDSQKQRIARYWCDNVAHFRLASEVVEYILGQDDTNSPFSYEDITNNVPTGQISINGVLVEFTEEKRIECLEFYDYLSDKWFDWYTYLNNNGHIIRADLANKQYERVRFIRDDLDSLDCGKYPQIYSWFSCSQRACEELEKSGECTLKGQYWGRTAGGQSITLDYVIQELAFKHYTLWNEQHITHDRLVKMGVL